MFSICIQVVENEKVALKSLTKRLVQEVDALQSASLPFRAHWPSSLRSHHNFRNIIKYCILDASEMGKLSANSIQEYSRLFEDGSLFGTFLRSNVLKSFLNISLYDFSSFFDLFLSEL